MYHSYFKIMRLLCFNSVVPGNGISSVINQEYYWQIWCTSYFWALQPFQMFIRSKITFYYALSYSADFKAPWELWNPLSKAVPGTFQEYGRHSKCYCSQDQVNFRRSDTWQIVIIFNSAYGIKNFVNIDANDDLLMNRYRPLAWMIMSKI